MHFRAKGVSISTATVRNTSLAVQVVVIKEHSVELVFQLYRWCHNAFLARAGGIPSVSHSRVLLRKFAAVRYVSFERTQISLILADGTLLSLLQCV